MTDSTTATPITTTGTDAEKISTESKQGWRKLLPVHPAAELFPLMSEAEIRELADDIKKHGLRERVVLWDDPTLGTCDRC